MIATSIVRWQICFTTVMLPVKSASQLQGRRLLRRPAGRRIPSRTAEATKPSFRRDARHDAQYSIDHSTPRRSLTRFVIKQHALENQCVIRLSCRVVTRIHVATHTRRRLFEATRKVEGSITDVAHARPIARRLANVCARVVVVVVVVVVVS